MPQADCQTPVPAGPPVRRLLCAAFFLRAVNLEGVGTFVGGLTAGFAAAGVEVTLLLPEGSTPPAVGAIRTTFFRTGLGALWRYSRRLGELSRDQDAVLLMENNPNVAFSGGRCRARRPPLHYFYTPLWTPLRYPCHGRFCRQTLKHRISKWGGFARLIGWRGRRCCVATEFQAAQIRRLGGDAAVVAGSSWPRALALPERGAARRSLGWDPVEPIVGYLGHFSPAKGVDGLLEAIEELPGVRLHVAWSGKGVLPPVAQRRLERWEGAGRVVLARVVDPGPFLAACDVVVLPYRHGSIHHLPQVMLEALAAATAVISTDVGGVGEFLRRTGVGGVVAPRASGALVTAVRQALAERAATHALGRRGHELFCRELCREVACTRFLDLLRADDWPAALAAVRAVAAAAGGAPP